MKSISTNSAPVVLSKQEYDEVIASMPNGMNGFLEVWGLQQFAAAVAEALIHKAAHDASAADRMQKLQTAIRRKALEQHLDRVRDLRVSEAFFGIVEFVYGSEDV